jgi:hypothetical protein
MCFRFPPLRHGLEQNHTRETGDAQSRVTLIFDAIDRSVVSGARALASRHGRRLAPIHSRAQELDKGETGTDIAP